MQKTHQLTKIIGEVLALFRLRAKDDSPGSLKLKEAVLMKALPKVIGKVNVQLRL